jgi:hypothetical protein
MGSSSAPSQSGHDVDADSINPNVTIIPPSPRNSDMTVSDSSSNRNSAHRSSEDLRGLNHKPSRERRMLALSLDSNSRSPVTPSSDEATTPTPQRPMIGERDSTMRPLSNSNSVGDLRGKVKAAETSHPRSATTAGSTQLQRGQEDAQRRRSNSIKSNRSGLNDIIKSVTSSHSNSKHERTSSVPTLPTSTSILSGDEVMSPIVESPTRINHAGAFGNISHSPTGHDLSTSATVPNIPSSALLAAPDNSDAVSVYSVTTGKKRRIFRRLSVKEPNTPTTPGLPSSTPQRSNKSPKRKNTGLAAALATTGLAMANSTVLTPQVTPAEVLARDTRSNSLGSNGIGISATGTHRTRSSIDRTRSPPRSRQPSINYAASDVSDQDSFMSGIGGGSDDEDDELDLDADDIPVTGFAVASARRNQEFHEMFPGVPEGDYLIEGACCGVAHVYPRLFLVTQIMAAPYSVKSSSKGDCTYPRTMFVSTPTFSVGLQM